MGETLACSLTLLYSGTLLLTQRFFDIGVLEIGLLLTLCLVDKVILESPQRFGCLAVTEVTQDPLIPHWVIAWKHTIRDVAVIRLYLRLKLGLFKFFFHLKFQIRHLSPVILLNFLD